jgi:hypothetical protein
MDINNATAIIQANRNIEVTGVLPPDYAAPINEYLTYFGVRPSNAAIEAIAAVMAVGHFRSSLRAAVIAPSITLLFGDNTNQAVRLDTLVNLQADVAGHGGPAQMTVESITSVHALYTQFVRPFYEWTSCIQIKPLKAKNLRNLFKSFNYVVEDASTVAEIFDRGAAGIPALMPVQAVRNALEVANKPFLKYHTSFASSSKLIIKARGAIGTLGDAIITNAEMAAVNAADGAPWDAALATAIQPLVIGKAAAILKALKSYPDGWFQGDKEYADLPVNLRNKILAAVEKYNALSANTAAIDASTTVQAVVTAYNA